MRRPFHSMFARVLALVSALALLWVCLLYFLAYYGFGDEGELSWLMLLGGLALAALPSLVLYFLLYRFYRAAGVRRSGAAERFVRRLAGGVAATFLISAALSGGFVHFENQREIENARTKSLEVALSQSRRLREVLRDAGVALSTLQHLLELGGGELAGFDSIAREMLKDNPAVANLQLAPDGVVRRIVPLAGHQKAIGHDLLADPARSAEAQAAIRTGRMTLAGPMRLRQGGVAVILRQPVFIGEHLHQGRFWGFVSALLFVDRLLDESGVILLQRQGYDWQLTRLGQSPNSLRLLGASTRSTLMSPTTLTIDVPNGQWLLRLAPVGGWVTPNSFLIDGLLVFLIVAVTTLMAYNGFHQPLALLLRVRQRTGQLRDSNRRLQQEIRNRAQVELQLRENELSLRQAQHLARLGSWRHDVGSNSWQWSNEVYHQLGIAPDTAASWRVLLGAVHRDDRPMVETAWRQALEGAPYDIEHRIVVAGEVRWVRQLASVHFDSQDNPLWAVGTLQDITDQKLVQQKIEVNEERLELALEGAELGLWDWDIQANRAKFNRRWAEMLGYQLSKLDNSVAQWEDMVHPDDLPRVQKALEAHLSGEAPVFEADHRLRHKNGEWRWIHTRGKVLERDDKGYPLRAVGTHLDVTERVWRQQAMAESQEFLDLLLNSSAEGIFGINRDGICTFVNRRAVQLLGYDQPDELVGEHMCSLLHLGEDESAAAEKTCRIHASFSEEKEISASDERMWRKDGKPIPVEYHAAPMRRGGEVVGSVVVFSDISERKARDLELRKLSLAVEYSPAATVITSPEPAIEYVNPRFSEISGYSFEEVHGRNPSLWQSGKTPQEVYEQLWATITAGRVWKGELLNRRKDGSLMLESVSIAPITDDDGQIIYYVAVKEDITERRALEKTIWRQANFDSLTGVANREQFRERVERALTRARRSRLTVGLLFIDLNKFKPVNDEYGHDAGDLVLQQVARRLQSAVRESDTVARVGGDEFAVLVEDLKQEQPAGPLTEKVLQAIVEQPYQLVDQQVRIGAAIGLAMFPEDGANFDQLLAHADTAMYQAKALGGDHVVRYRPSDENP